MNLGMYKPGQGYWTRVLTAIGIGALTLAGIFWLTHLLSSGGHVYGLLEPKQSDVEAALKALSGKVPSASEVEDALKVAQGQFTAKMTVVAKILWVAIPLLVAGGLWVVLNRPRVVDFMIATETEMKKVSWPDRKSIISMTAIVIGGLLGLAALVWGIDTVFTLLFRAIHILP